jgi:hypothetical protein
MSYKILKTRNDNAIHFVDGCESVKGVTVRLLNVEDGVAVAELSRAVTISAPYLETYDFDEFRCLTGE